MEEGCMTKRYCLNCEKITNFYKAESLPDHNYFWYCASCGLNESIATLWNFEQEFDIHLGHSVKDIDIKEFFKTPIVLFNNNIDKLIGKVLWLKKSDLGFECKIKFKPCIDNLLFQDINLCDINATLLLNSKDVYFPKGKLIALSVRYMDKYKIWKEYSEKKL